MQECGLFEARDVGEAALARVGCVAGSVEIKQLQILDDALLETEEVGAGRVGLGRGGVAEQATEVVEMSLVGGGFRALVSGKFRLTSARQPFLLTPMIQPGSRKAL